MRNKNKGLVVKLLKRTIALFHAVSYKVNEKVQFLPNFAYFETSFNPTGYCCSLYLKDLNISSFSFMKIITLFRLFTFADAYPQLTHH